MILPGEIKRVVDYQLDRRQNAHCFIIEHPDGNNMEIFHNYIWFDDFGVNELIKERSNNLGILFPVTVLRNMVTTGVGLANSRIALLHSNGTITDLVQLHLFS